MAYLAAIPKAEHPNMSQHLELNVEVVGHQHAVTKSNIAHLPSRVVLINAR